MIMVKMLQKRIDYFNKFKEKRGLTIKQNEKLQLLLKKRIAADAQLEEQQAAYQWTTSTSNYSKDKLTGGYQSGSS